MKAEAKSKRPEIRRLEKLSKKTKDIRMKLRYDVIRLHLKGRTKTEIADIFAITYQTVRNYIEAYTKSGIEGLAIGQSPGRSKKLTDEQEQQLYACITTNLPKDVGFEPFANWTASLACQWVLKMFGISFSERGMRAVFYRLNLSYTRPTYTLKKADPQRQEEFLNEFEEVKRKLIFGEIDHVLFEDESMIRDYQAIGKSWFPKGQQKIIPTYGKHHGAKLVGFLNYETGEIYVEEHDKYDAEVFLNFMKNIIAKYHGKIVVILDNAKIHHAKLLQPFLDEHKDTLTLMFLPPYSPNLNMIEELWGWLKQSVINNVFFETLEDIRLAVRGFINWMSRNPTVVIDRLCLQF